MNDQEQKEMVRRWASRFGAEPASSPPRDVIERTLRRLVEAGAARLGLRADDADRSACDIAPPLARLIDHTALQPETSVEEIRILCDEARRFCFASVCVHPCYVALASAWLAGASAAACTVVGFPLGASRPETKAREAELAVGDGAAEVDMVLNVGMLRSREYDYVEADIRAVVDAVRAAGTTVKVILETALLGDEEKVIACLLARKAGADFVKTSTGFSRGGATASDVALMRRTVGREMGVKASGGIRSAEDAQKMIAFGATRIGTSASVAILQGLERSGGR